MAEVTMPRLSDSMEEGTIIRWLKSDGEQVSRGDELVEIETDKATMTYEADQDGVLSIVAEEGRTLPIGEVIARIGEAGGDGADPAARKEPEVAEEGGEAEEAGEAKEAAEAKEAKDAEAPEEPREAETKEAPQPAEAEVEARTEPAPEPELAPPPPERDGERVKASPVARRMARRYGVELTALEGSGPGGRIVKADVEAAAGDGKAAEAPARAEEERAPEPEPAARETGKGEVRTEELSRSQQLIARRMAESKATVPHFTLQAEIDMQAAVEAREQLREVAGDDQAVPSLNDMIVKACALALREFPRANGAYRDGRWELYGRVNVGIAVAAEDSLVVPTIFDADRKGLGQIARESHELAEKVRAGKVTPPELSGGTFTVSNLGMYGISNFAAVINPPQAAILAVGAVEPKPAVRSGQVTVRQRMGVTLACDHRILYGAPAAEFLARIRTLLEHPAGLAL
jgi:pyruvate dehydrogenase E2 component (dihydrolipoamide acetyltransferase)